jgi:lipoprotein-anchoring transpeptidase ErfK/SrfK
VAAQVLLPTTAGISAAEDAGAYAASSVVTAPIAATALPNVVAAVSVTSVRSGTTVPRHSGKGHRVVYSISRQRVWLIGAAGRVQHTYLVSGRLSQPEPGHYRVYSKSRRTSSTVSDETMQYMVRFTHGENTGTPIGFHSIPRDRNGHPAQSVDDLGKPLSHGCIRQRLRDAAFLWHFSPVGTKVVVTH